MRAVGTLEWPIPRAWPNSWAETISRLVPASVPTVHCSSSSKCVSPEMGASPGKKAWARVPPEHSKHADDASQVIHSSGAA